MKNIKKLNLINTIRTVFIDLSQKRDVTINEGKTTDGIVFISVTLNFKDGQCNFYANTDMTITSLKSDIETFKAFDVFKSENKKQFEDELLQYWMSKTTY